MRPTMLLIVRGKFQVQSRPLACAFADGRVGLMQIQPCLRA
jgi:hypothetical protein